MNRAIRALLLDLDGVFHVGDQLIPGAVETLNYLRDGKIPFRIVTNTTTKSRASLAQYIQRIGLPIAPDDLVTASYAAVLHLRRMGLPSCHLVLTDDAKQDFSEFRVDDDQPDVVVIGDLDRDWTYDRLNDIFLKIVGGAQMIALHKGRYWQVPEGLRVDIGLFVAGLEYVTGKTATVIGKPSPEIFRLAVSELGLPVEQVAMIGDDIHNDVAGAQKAGLIGVLVKTGKYRPETTTASGVVPDAVLDSIAELPSWWDSELRS